MKRIQLVSFMLMFVCVFGAYGAETNHYERLRTLNDWDKVEAYVRALPEEEVWVLANQVRDDQGNWQAYPSGVLLALYYGENWERKTPTLNKVLRIIQDNQFHPALRGAVAASGFEISRSWEIDDRLRYFDSVVPLLINNDIPAAEKAQMAEYSFRAFKRCLSELRLLSDTNDMKSVLLDAFHTRAQVMMKTLSSLIEMNPKEQAEGAIGKALEDYARIYEHEDFPKSLQFQEAVDEAAKSRAVLLQHQRK